MSRVALPEMERHNYADSLATGAVASGGVIGILIPPSVTMIVYGIVVMLIVMLAALPTGASCFVLAQQQNIYIRRTSSVTLFSTLIAVLTIGAFFALPQVADALQP